MKRIIACAAVISAVATIGCHRQADSEPAVRQAVERYLASRPNLNMQGMNLEVSRILFRKDEAEADVTFRAKGDAQAVMSIHYTLKRQGGRWEVQAPAEGGHGAGAASATSPELPGGHPQVAPPAPAGDLPPGHPPVRNQP